MASTAEDWTASALPIRVAHIAATLGYVITALLLLSGRIDFVGSSLVLPGDVRHVPTGFGLGLLIFAYFRWSEAEKIRQAAENRRRLTPHGGKQFFLFFLDALAVSAAVVYTLSGYLPLTESFWPVAIVLMPAFGYSSYLAYTRFYETKN